MIIQDYKFTNQKILSCSSQDGTVIADINIKSKQIAIMIGKAKFQDRICPLIHIYSCESAKQIFEFVLPFQFARRVKFSSNGKYLIIYGLNLEMAIKSLQNQEEPPKILKGHQCFVEAIAIHENESIMVSGADCDNLYFWDLEKKQLLFTILADINYLKSIAISITDTLVAASCNEEYIIIWDYKLKKIYKTFNIRDGCGDLQFPADNSHTLLAYRKDSNSLLILDISLKKIIRSLELFSVLLVSLDIENKNPILAVGQNNLFQKKGCISVWNWVTGELLEKNNLDEAVANIKIIQEQKVIITKREQSALFWI